jgi:predicted glycosyltransferase
MTEEEYGYLQNAAGKNVHVFRFTSDFLSYLAAADLSVSMGGYNTSMNILSAGVPALIWPYPGDREQGLRAQRLARIGAISVIGDEDLQAERLGVLMHQRICRKSYHTAPINLNGSLNAARWLTQGESR